MRIVSKAYVLIAILIIAAAFNLFLLYQNQNSAVSQSYSIINAGDVKVKSEAISALATSVASGNIADKDKLQKEIDAIQSTLDIIKNGGNVKGQTLEKIPSSLSSEYNKVSDSWDSYKTSVLKAEKTTLFDSEATNAMNYVLQKNQDLVLITDRLVKEVEGLDRNYNNHKNIAKDLAECAKIIGEQSLLMSIGEGSDSQKELKDKNLRFEIGIRKLLQISTAGLDVESVGMTHEELKPIPRENSESLRTLDPLWESMRIKLQILEDRSILSPEYNAAKNEMNLQKSMMFEDIDNLLDSWNNEIINQSSNEQMIIQVLLVVDIIVFFIVLFMIKQSFLPLESITKALSRVKEGVYGERIEYHGTDEVGDLVNNFNIMSDTIKEKEEEAKKTDIAKDEFLAMITHELKTPLVPIQGYSDILLSEHLGKLTDKQRERINIIKSSSEALLSIISDLLDAQKLELGQLRMRKENHNIKETLERAIEVISPEAQTKNIKINLNSEDIMLEYDSDRIRQVVTNLIKNSINAIDVEAGKIDVTVENYPTEIKISVKDNGVGIEPEKQKDLFKKFYQVDASLTREKGGSGLGLAICKGIVENHLGKIGVVSIPNQGSTFFFTIPKNSLNETKSPVGIT